MLKIGATVINSVRQWEFQDPKNVPDIPWDFPLEIEDLPIHKGDFNYSYFNRGWPLY